MQKYLIPILLSGSLILTISCSRQPYSYLNREKGSDCVSRLIPDFSVIRYRTSVELAGREFGGTLIIKRMNDQSTRAVFTGDAGITFFDMGFNGDDFKVYYINNQLNRKAVIRQLQNDIKLILMAEVKGEAVKAVISNNEMIHFYGSDKNTAAYITTSDCTALIRAERWKKGKLNSKAHIYSMKNNHPDSVIIEHNRINFTISLKQIAAQ